MRCKENYVLSDSEFKLWLYAHLFSQYGIETGTWAGHLKVSCFIGVKASECGNKVYYIN